MKARERIGVTADRRCVVPADHEDARFLLVGRGCEIDDREAARYGLEEGRLPADWTVRHRGWRSALESEGAAGEPVPAPSNCGISAPPSAPRTPPRIAPTQAPS